MKKSQTLNTLIDENIKLNDKVFLKDGSELSSIKKPYDNFYIANAYPNLTSSSEPLNNIEATVIEVGVKDAIYVSDYDWCYLQDIVIDINGAKFRTASQFVYKED